MNTLVFWVLFIVGINGEQHTMAFPSQIGARPDYARAMCAQMAQSYAASVMGAYVSGCHRVLVPAREWSRFEPFESER